MIWYLLAPLYALFWIRGWDRARPNIMRGKIRDRHSWRWWTWVVLCFPCFALGRCGYLRIGRFLFPLPRRLFPVHMRVRYR